MVVGGHARRLQDEHIFAAHVLEQLDHHFAIAEAPDAGPAKVDVQVTHHLFGELGIRAAGEHH